MKSRISFFDKTVIRKDITRFMPLWLVYFIGGTLVMLFLSVDNTAHSLAGSLGSCLGAFCWINMIYAALSAQLLFGDLYSSRLCNALHAMPLRREGWFASHMVSGLLFSLVPNLVGILVTLPWLGEFWFAAFLWLLGMELQYLFFFGLAVFCIMCTGNRFAMVAIYSILNFLALIAQWLVTAIFEPLLYGVSVRTEQFSLFCPVLQMTGHEYWAIDALDRSYLLDGGSKYDWYFAGLGSEWIYLAVMAVLGIAFGALALIMYRRRRLECAGDFMAVSWLKPVFAVVYTLCVGALFALVGELIFSGYVVFLIVGLAIGWFTGQMLLMRTVKVFRVKTILGFAALAAALLLSLGITRLDPLGVTRWVPSIHQVEEVTVNAGFQEISVSYKSADRLQQVLDIHSEIVEEGPAEAGEANIYIDISYTLVDGRTVNRSYQAPVVSGFMAPLKAFMTAPESVLGYEDWDAFLASIAAVEVGGGADLKGSILMPDQISALLEAVKADCEAGTMAQSWRFHENEEQLYYIVLTVRDGGRTHYRDIYVFEGNKNTVRWIEENLK